MKYLIYFLLWIFNIINYILMTIGAITIIFISVSLDGIEIVTSKLKRISNENHKSKDNNLN